MGILTCSKVKQLNTTGGEDYRLFTWNEFKEGGSPFTLARDKQQINRLQNYLLNYSEKIP